MSEFLNQQLLTNIFGDWPSFHDAEIISLLLDRGGDAGPFLEVKIHLWQMTSDIDETGHYILTNHTLARMRFDNVLLEMVSSFNHQNVLWELEIIDIDPIAEGNVGRRYQVAMPTSYGCEALFKCDAVRVISAEPFQKLPSKLEY